MVEIIFQAFVFSILQAADTVGVHQKSGIVITNIFISRPNRSVSKVMVGNSLGEMTGVKKTDFMKDLRRNQ